MWTRYFSFIVGCLLLSSVCSESKAQADSVKVAPIIRPTTPASAVIDSMTVSPEKKHSPRKATLLSLALPGLGQAYNRSYWKIPIIYGGFAIFGYLIIDFNKQYKLYLSNFTEKKLHPSAIINIGSYQNVSLDNLRNAKDSARRYRDLNIILSAGLWALNVVEANVHAHLKGFDLNDDLSLTIQPGCSQDIIQQPVAGLTMTLHLK